MKDPSYTKPSKVLTNRLKNCTDLQLSRVTKDIHILLAEELSRATPNKSFWKFEPIHHEAGARLRRGEGNKDLTSVKDLNHR